jgi:hypothetical protein
MQLDPPPHVQVPVVVEHMSPAEHERHMAPFAPH